MLQLRLLIFFSIIGYNGFGQPGPIKNLRYDDDFRYLLEDSVIKKGTEHLKFIPISKRGSKFISLGGELREWYEIRRNPNFGDVRPGTIENPNGSLQHRLMLHVDVSLSKSFRIFTQLNSTFQFWNPNPPIPEIIEDALGLHQFFGEIQLRSFEGNNGTYLRIGRQEYNFGNELMISSREGPNNRQPFDGFTFISRKKEIDLYAFVATPVIIEPGVFDNRHISEYVWGVYSYFRKKKVTHIDAYYFGYSSDRRSYNFVGGDQHRHTLGTRIWSHGRNIFYEVEVMGQTGKFNSQTIFAANFTGEGRYIFQDALLKPMVGIGLSYITGDYSGSDNMLNTFDPLYPKPVYGLATPQGPSNIAHIKPTFGIQPVDGLFINFQWYWLARTSIEDGTYTPSMVQVRPVPGESSSNHRVGIQYALEMFYIVNRNFTFLTFISIVKPGDYVLDTGLGKDVFFWASAIQYKF